MVKKHKVLLSNKLQLALAGKLCYKRRKKTLQNTLVIKKELTSECLK